MAGRPQAAARIVKMIDLEGYLELGELLTIKYDPSDPSGQLGQPYVTLMASKSACPLFSVENPWIVYNVI